MAVADLEDLLSANAVRERCATIYRAAERHQAEYFQLHPDKLEACVDFVMQVTDLRYPDGRVPFHSRWRHFEFERLDLWRHYRDTVLAGVDADEAARIAVELVFISVLLDAGAGDRWRYREPISGNTLSRSEGLAAASIHAFFGPHFRGADGLPVVDADILDGIDGPRLAADFQAESGNPLAGIEGRVRLLRGLAGALKPKVFSLSGGPPRLGHIYDYLRHTYAGGTLRAGELLGEILALFGCIWPSGLVRDGICLGDTGQHGLIRTGDTTDGLVPFHKLSQWLAYSLLEPLEWGGIRVTHLDDLTGLPEYRNGGLFIDSGVLSLKDPSQMHETHAPHSELITEWRALTVVLLDKTAEIIRRRKDVTREQLPLASILQGGTWSAGRKLAAKRTGGGPPLTIKTDGTVF